MRPYRCPGCLRLLANRTSSEGIYVRLVDEDSKTLKGKPSVKVERPYRGANNKRVSGYSFNCPNCGVLVHVARKDHGNWVYLAPPPEKVKVYLSASTALRETVLARAAQVEARGAEVVSTWPKQFPPNNLSELEDYWAERTAKDLEEIQAANVFVIFTEVPNGHIPRGGLHSELGAALMGTARVVVIGQRSQPFHFHPKVECLRSWEDFIEQIGGV